MRRRRPPVAVLCLASGAACAPAAVSSGVGRSDSALGWEGFQLGMTVEEAARRSDGELELRRIDDRCGETGARLFHQGRELFLGFTEAAGVLRSIVLRLPPEATEEEIVRDLERRLPGLRYRPDPRWPNMSERENPKPVYVHPDLPDQGFLVGTEEGWLWISYLRCLDGATIQRRTSSSGQREEAHA